MTKKFEFYRFLEGKTVAVLAAGPSMNKEVVKSLQHHYCIAVNYVCLLATDADMLVALDGNWPDELINFQGMKLCGVEDDNLDAYFVGLRHEEVKFADNHIVHFRDSGLAAIRIAEKLGASKIILAGFNPSIIGNFVGYPEPAGLHFGVSEALKNLIADLRAKGIKVEEFNEVLLERE